jgi:glycosyltransferase involved in cell wall biosynthesis
MRIGFDATPMLTTPRFGIHQHTSEVIRHLTRLYPADEFLLFFDGDLQNRPSFDHAATAELGPNAELVPLKTFGPTAWIAALAWWRWHLPRAIARHRIDVFHGLAHAIPFTRRCPLVLTVHDLRPIEFVSWTRDRAAAHVRASLMSAIRRASAIATVSEATKHGVQAATPGRTGLRIEVTPNAAREVFRPVTDQAALAAVRQRYGLPDTFLLTVGADAPRRNYARLIQAFADARRRDARVGHLVVVGNTDWQQTRAFRLVQDLGVYDWVAFCRGMSDEELAAAYTLGRTYVCPSLLEGFGMPVIEAMACGTPVICSDIPALREVAEEDADYFDPIDVNSIRDALLRCAIPPQPNGGSAKRLLERASRFSWERAAHTAYSLYEHVHESKCGRTAHAGRA